MRKSITIKATYAILTSAMCLCIGCGNNSEPVIESEPNTQNVEESLPENKEEVEEEPVADTLEEPEETSEEVETQEEKTDEYDLEAIKAQFPNLIFKDEIMESDVLFYTYEPQEHTESSVDGDFVDGPYEVEEPDPEDNYLVIDDGDLHTYENYKFGYKVSYTNDQFDDYTWNQNTDKMFGGQKLYYDESGSGNGFLSMIEIVGDDNSVEDAVYKNLSLQENGRTVVLTNEIIGAGIPSVKMETMSVMEDDGEQTLIYSRYYFIKNSEGNTLRIDIFTDKWETDVYYFDPLVVCDPFLRIVDTFDLIDVKPYEVPVVKEVESSISLEDGEYNLDTSGSIEATDDQVHIAGNLVNSKTGDSVDVDSDFAISKHVYYWEGNPYEDGTFTCESRETFESQKDIALNGQGIRIKFRSNVVTGIYYYPF